MHNRFVSVLLTLMLVTAAAPALAADVPASLCITATTTASNTAAIAAMEKDATPYAGNADAAAAIQTYRTDVSVAWEAMQQPYCGYGAYGNASAIKSYGKTVSRARATFLAAVKNLKKVAGTLPPMEEPAMPVAEQPTNDTVAAPVAAVVAPAAAVTATPKAKTVAVASARITSGLARGQRSQMIKNLQTVLTSHFGITNPSLLTGYFGPKTESLVLKFQLEQHIIASSSSPGAGRVGPKTTAALNAL